MSLMLESGTSGKLDVKEEVEECTSTSAGTIVQSGHT